MKAHRPTKFKRGRNRQRGMVMALTMLILLSIMAMVLLGLLANQQQQGRSGTMTVADNSVRAAAAVDQSVTALNLAEAGVEDTVLWLSAQSAPPNNTSEFAPSQSSFTLPLWNATTITGPPPRSVVQYPDAAHTFSVTLYPNTSNSGSSQKAFLIESIGNDNGFTQILHVYVQQTSFGHFSFFENGAGGGSWSDTNHIFDGPVHMNYSAQGLSLAWKSGTSPMFSYAGSDAYTVGFHLGWIDQNNNSSTSPVTSTDWATVSAGGSGSVHDGQNDIPMPTVSTTQKQAALGTLGFTPVTNGATICPSGGIYIHGDVQQMTLSADPASNINQIIELYQTDSFGNPLYTKIEISPSANQTTMQTGTYDSSGNVTLNAAAVQPLPSMGTTNGIVFCDGNIGGQGSPATGGLRGTVADNALDTNGNVTHTSSLTIATDAGNGKNINIDGSLLYNTQRQIQQDQYGNYEFRNSSGQIVYNASSTVPAGDEPIFVPETADTGNFGAKAGRLGVVTNKLVIGEKTYNATGLVAGSNFTSPALDAIVYSSASLSADNNGGRSSGTLLIMGGNIHNGPQTVSTHLFGDYQYDTRLSDTPPPFFPTTSNRYTRLSWQRVSSTLQ